MTAPAPLRPRALTWLARLHPASRSYLAQQREALAAATSRVSDLDGGWAALTAPLRDVGWSDQLHTLEDALEAARKNPLAARIVSLATDFVVGNGITLTSPRADVQAFITRWWNHPQNHMDLRLDSLCDDLTRDGELFPVLHSNPGDGMPYLRIKPAAVIDQIRWAPGDYETELAYHETPASAENAEGRWWPAPGAATGPASAPEAPPDTAVMLHYAINRPAGCVRGQSELAPALLWLQRYSHWLEDRARLNWAARMFLWLVTVPQGRVGEKQQQYRTPPESGSIVVHDDGEVWDMKTPAIAASDVKADGRAIKRMAAVATGTPLHYLADEENANLATAEAMAEPTIRHYARRQRHFCYVLRDLATQAFNRHAAFVTPRPAPASMQDVQATVQEIARADNQKLAASARQIVQMLAELRRELAAAGIAPAAALNRKTLELAFRFAGETLDPEDIEALLQPGQEAAQKP